MTFVLFFAMLMRSRPERGENSTAYTTPSYKSVSESHRKKKTTKRTYRTNDIRNMAHTRPTRSTKVQNLRTRLDKNIIQPTKHPRRQLAPKGIPNPILRLRPLHTTLNRYPLLPIHTLPRYQILRDQHMVLPFGDEHPRVSMRLQDGVAPPFRSTTATTTTASATATAGSPTTGGTAPATSARSTTSATAPSSI